MSHSRLTSSLFLVFCAAVLAATLSACFVSNRSIISKGPSFDRSFEGVEAAMKSTGYTIAKEDRAAGEIQTEKRTIDNWWWVIDAHVAQDGTVDFKASGSDRVQKGDKIHHRVLNFVEKLKYAFDEQMGNAHAPKE